MNNAKFVYFDKNYVHENTLTAVLAGLH